MSSFHFFTKCPRTAEHPAMTYKVGCFSASELRVIVLLAEEVLRERYGEDFLIARYWVMRPHGGRNPRITFGHPRSGTVWTVLEVKGWKTAKPFTKEVGTLSFDEHMKELARLPCVFDEDDGNILNEILAAA